MEVENLLKGLNIPRMVRIRQHFPRKTLADVSAVIRNELGREEIIERIKAGDRVIARIEVEPAYMKMVLENHDAIVKKLQELGYKYISLDLIGYQSGSMNKVLD